MNPGKDNIPLAQLQACFKRNLMEDDADIVDYIVDDEPQSNHPRLAIYRHAYYARLEEALAQDYEGIHTLVGDDDFTELCRRYTDCYPSTFPSLRWFGQSMHAFLQNNQPYSEHPYLAELARFEWLLVDAFDAPDTDIAGMEEAAQLPPEHWPGLRITLHPSLHWLAYHWNILPVWQAVSGGGTIPSLQRLPAEEHCVVWRQQRVTQYRTLERDELQMLSGIALGENFSQLCARLADAGLAPEQVPLRAASILKTWLSLGMIAKLSLS